MVFNAGVILGENPAYVIVRSIGRGSFGDVYEALDKMNNRRVAIKVEASLMALKHLKKEFTLYQRLESGQGFPTIYGYGDFGNYSFMTMELFGPSLEELFNEQQRRFSQKTVLMLAIQMLSIFKNLHGSGIIHRDVKPQNFVVWFSGQQTVLKLIDLGLALPFAKDEIHSSGKVGSVGTTRFMSLSVQMGEQARAKDDLESAAYMLIYFLQGSLPWQGIQDTNKSVKDNLILIKKKSVTPEQLCKGYSQAFSFFIRSVRECVTSSTYVDFSVIFNATLRSLGHSFDHQYDWTQTS